MMTNHKYTEKGIQNGKPLIGSSQTYLQLASRYAHHFQLRTCNVCRQAQDYLCGLVQSTKRNMERMAEVVSGSDEQAVMDQVATETDALLGGSEESALYIDESAIKKQGKHSVGVARQWNGRLGKVDNSQVSVFAALGRGGRVNLIDARSFIQTSTSIYQILRRIYRLPKWVEAESQAVIIAPK